MKYSITAASFLSLAAAQTIPIPVLPDLGECVYQGCLINGFAQTDCGLTDNECYCNNFEEVSSNVMPCLRELDCQSSDINSLVEAFQTFCNSLGAASASIDLPLTLTPTGSESAVVLPIYSSTTTVTEYSSMVTVTETSSFDSEATSSPTGSVTETETVSVSETVSETQTETVTSPSASPTNGDGDSDNTEDGDENGGENGDENGDDDSAAPRAQAMGLGLAVALVAAVAL